MTKLFYLDASAWVKVYIEEAGTASLQDLIGSSEILSASALGHIEVAATVNRRGRGDGTPKDDVLLRLQALDHDWANRMYQVKLSEAQFAEARILAVSSGLRGADAIHLTAALTIQRAAKPSGVVVMVAADRELLAASAKLGLEVLRPE